MSSASGILTAVLSRIGKSAGGPRPPAADYSCGHADHSCRLQSRWAITSTTLAHAAHRDSRNATTGCNAPDFNLGTTQYLWFVKQLAETQQKSRFTFVATGSTHDVQIPVTNYPSFFRLEALR